MIKKGKVNQMKKIVLMLILFCTTIFLVSCSNIQEESQTSTTISTTQIETTEQEGDTSEEETIEEETKQEQAQNGIVEQSYILACDLNKSDLNYDDSTGYWLYNGISLTADDCEFIDAAYNTIGSVNQGAIYRAVANEMQHIINSNFVNHDIDLQDISKILFGKESQDNEDFIAISDSIAEFITNNESLNAVMKAFENLNSVEGEFDYSNDTYNFIIVDVDLCA